MAVRYRLAFLYFSYTLLMTYKLKTQKTQEQRAKATQQKTPNITLSLSMVCDFYSICKLKSNFGLVVRSRQYGI